jgi:MFS family permease
LPTVGLALMLVFAGGAAGKLVCGFLGARIGVLATVVATEGVTALGIATLLPLPLEAILALLPAIGVALNGTSSVLYGTVPELAPAHRRQRAFGLFYTGTIGAGALSPAIYGLFGDIFGISVAMVLLAAIVLVTPALGLEAELGTQRQEVVPRTSPHVGTMLTLLSATVIQVSEPIGGACALARSITNSSPRIVSTLYSKWLPT